MARTAGVHDLLENSLERIHRSPSEWMRFLSFQAKFYRYNTTNAALIYAQRPEATACATMNYWNNRLNRWIRRGSHPYIGNLQASHQRYGHFPRLRRR